jgi:hypothetical protein
MQGNLHVPFLGGWAGAIPPGYPAGESHLASLSRRMYGPHLLCHQQDPTQMCGKVTTRTAPADTVPTVTHWHLNREGTVYRPASGGDGAGWMGW